MWIATNSSVYIPISSKTIINLSAYNNLLLPNLNGVDLGLYIVYLQLNLMLYLNLSK